MVLVDTSVWIAYFKGIDSALPLNNLIDLNIICTNDLILAELIPHINYKKETTLRNILYKIKKIRLDIDWEQIIEMQTINLRNGINKIGIPDLIIAQNAMQNNLSIFTLDKHFEIMSKLHKIKVDSCSFWQ